MDWSKASSETIQRIVEEAEAYLDGQLRLATSADQRASVLAGVFTAAGTAIIVGLISVSVTNILLRDAYPIYLGGSIAAVMFVIAAIQCVKATLPIGFWLPGNQPESWYPDVESGKELRESLAEEAEHTQEKIAENRQTLESNARWFRRGAKIGIAAPLVGGGLWLATFSCRLISE